MRAILVVATASALLALAACKPPETTSNGQAVTTQTQTQDQSSTTSSDNSYDGTIVKVCHDGTKVYKGKDDPRYFIVEGDPAQTQYLDSTVTLDNFCTL